MTTVEEETRAREHLAQLRQAARGLGRDFAIEFKTVERKIERFPGATAKEAKYLAQDIEDDLSKINHTVKTELRKVPGGIKGGLETAGGAISAGATRAYSATRDAATSASHVASEGTRNAFARAAGVKRKPMRQWAHPSDSGSSSSEP